MAASKDERDRILRLIETGRVTAEQAAQLLDTLETSEHVSMPLSAQRTRERVIRVRSTNTNAPTHKVTVNATLPLSLLKTGLRLGRHFLPQLVSNEVTDLLQTIETGASGRLLDLQDLEKGERFEVFVE